MGSLFSRVYTTPVPKEPLVVKYDGYQPDSEDEESTSVSSLDHINRPPLSPLLVKKRVPLSNVPEVPNFFKNIVMDNTF
jgi:hypothetical protein